MKATKTKLKGDEILSIVLFILSFIFLSYVCIRCIEGIRMEAQRRSDQITYEERVEVLMPSISSNKPGPVYLNRLEDDRTPEEKRMYTYRRYATELGQEYGIDPNLILAVCEVESHYTPNIVGGGAVGMMQLIPFCHAATMAKYGYNENDLYDAYKNMKVGTEYLAKLVHKYNDIPFALVCYNKGEGGALGSGTRTSHYSDAVMAVYNRLSGGDIS